MNGPQLPDDDSDNVAFRVLVRGPRTEKLWNSYSDRTEAQVAASKLRGIGLNAFVELIDLDPEAVR
jgi:hypothetical protein